MVTGGLTDVGGLSFLVVTICGLGLLFVTMGDGDGLVPAIGAVDVVVRIVEEDRFGALVGSK